MTYAKGTTVAVARSKQEIESMLAKHGASKVGFAYSPTEGSVAFAMADRHVRFKINLWTMKEAPTYGRGYRTFTDTQRQELADQHNREVWRALALCIKAKLVSVESKVESFDQAFLAHIITPSGETVGERTLPAIAEAYKTGRDMPLLGAGG